MTGYPRFPGGLAHGGNGSLVRASGVANTQPSLGGFVTAAPGTPPGTPRRVASGMPMPIFRSEANVCSHDREDPKMTGKTARPAAKRFTPELLAEAAKLRESGLTWDKIGEQLDVRSTGLLSKRVREAAAPAKKAPAKARARRAEGHARKGADQDDGRRRARLRERQEGHARGRLGPLAGALAPPDDAGAP